MRRWIFFLFIIFGFLNLSFAGDIQTIAYTDSWGKAGIALEGQSRSGVQVNFSIQEFYLVDQPVDGQIMQSVKLPGVFLPNNTGAPDLPGMGRYIAIPQGATARLTIVGARTERLTGIEVAPAPRIPLETESGPLEYRKDPAIYEKNAFYPEQPILISEPTQIRGVDVVMLGITPFQYNPVTKELIVYRDLKIEVSFEGGNGHFGEDRLRSRWWDPILEDVLLNYQSLPAMDYNYGYIPPSETVQDVEYLIIAPDDPVFLAWADSIKQFRTLQGIRTGVVTTTEIGGNNATAIENYINNAYNNWNPAPAAVLLLGDYGTTGSTIHSPIYNSYCISDHIYADVNGNHMADIVLARITARDAAELEVMIHKFMDYERTPPTDPNYYLHPITAMGWQDERWFQICSETINGFWEYSLGKQPVRENAIYSGGPSIGVWSTNSNTPIVVNYFGPNGLGYIPATPSHLTNWSGSATGIINDINSGAFMLQHRDHGSVSGWGEPDFSIGHISSLNNVGKPTYVFSVNCLTGKFDEPGECFAERFHRHPQGGALGIIAATETSYSFVNDTYVWGLYDNMWPQFMPEYGSTPASRGVLPAFGNAAGKYFLQQSSWPYNPSNKEVTYYLFHHHGDAFSTVYTEMPQPLTVQHNAVLFGGQSTFTVTADLGALIALTVDGEIIGTALGTGAPVNITIPPQTPGKTMLVTVTKQNYYRYTGRVFVTVANGPYLYVMEPVMDDSNLNGNGIPECGETLDLQLKMTNLGVEQATNITGIISTDDPYLTILQDSIQIAVVDTADTIVAGSFQVSISPTTPHLHRCLFEVQLQADSAGIPNGYQWTQTLQFEVREGAHIELGQPQLTFPNTFLNFTSTLLLPVHNSGPDTLFISDVLVNLPQFSVPEPTLVVPPGGTEQLEIAFTPDSTLTYTDQLTLVNNDPMHFHQPLSVSGTGIYAPDILTPDSIRQVVDVTDSVTIPVVIENTGLGDLTFNAQIAGYEPGGGLRGAGGSDTYGHMWIDSDEPSGPTFEWLDISATGTEIPITGNNAISDPIDIGFPFHFYGVDYHRFRVCTNGWISFTTYSIAYNNFALPSLLAPRAMIAPLWDDLMFNADSRLYFENQGNKAIVQFQNVYQVTGEGPFTFQVILYDNANIVLQYLEVNNLLPEYTVGIQNHNADDGLTVAHNTAYLHDSLAVLISKHTWVSVAPMSGTIAGQSSQTLYLTFQTNNFPQGEFWASLQVESNDPDEGVVIIPIHMIVDSVLVGMEPLETALPVTFSLEQNWPNPFNPVTTIRYALPGPADVELVVYNLLGQRVKTLVKEKQPAGLFQVQWDGTNENGQQVASGIYIYRLQAGEKVAVRKMIFMK